MFQFCTSEPSATVYLAKASTCSTHDCHRTPMRLYTDHFLSPSVADSNPVTLSGASVTTPTLQPQSMLGPGPPTPTFISKTPTPSTTTVSTVNVGASEDSPPPLPPRGSRREGGSVSNPDGVPLSPLHHCADSPPVVPPRGDMAPPIPPRVRDSTSSHPPMTLPRACSSPGGMGRHFFPPGPGGSPSMTLPRQNFERDHPPPPPQPQYGPWDAENTPELPPKTYKQHSRKQSS